MISQKDTQTLQVRVAGERFLPVFVNVWLLYDAHKRSSSSNTSFARSSSSLLHPTRSRKFFHSSVLNHKYMIKYIIFLYKILPRTIS
jgi:hypothetical protein